MNIGENMSIDQEISELLKKHGITEIPDFKDSKKAEVLAALKTPNIHINWIGFENGSLVIDYDPIH
jgi:hypothetical protein